jgi:aryl-alcohol dehydrogenase-like predicted oxidoreductase
MNAALGLGTVQLGQAYGATNERGQVGPGLGKQLLDRAATLGVRYLDTARSYGDAEETIGSSGTAEKFRIVTKLPPVDGGEIDAATTADLRQTFFRSLARLRVSRVYGLLIHRVGDLSKPGAERLVALMEELREAGLVEHIGASVYDAAEIDLVRSRLRPDLVQLPLSLADQRLIKNGAIAALRKDGIAIHARSIFLQGLLLAEADRLPPFFRRWDVALRRWRSQLDEIGLLPLDASVRFALQTPGVEAVIVGVTALDELDAIARAARRTELHFDPAKFALEDEELLDPRKWPTPKVAQL